MGNTFMESPKYLLASESVTEGIPTRFATRYPTRFWTRL